MKNRILTIVAILLGLSVAAWATYNASNYSKQGGAYWMVGGTLDVDTGGLLTTKTGVRYYNAIADLTDAETTTTLWSQTTGTGWTIALGSNNGRDGALEALEIVSDTTVGDVATFTYGSNIDLTDYDYFGFWVKPASAIAASEFTVVLANSAGTVITGCSALAFPAVTVAAWNWVQIDISACTPRTSFRKLRLVAAASVAAETMNFTNFVFYKYSNGYGPANGEIQNYKVSSGTVTQGQFVSIDPIGTTPYMLGVRTAPTASYSVVGVACTTSTTAVLVQTSGVVNRPTAGAIADNADVQVTSGGVEVDDSGGVQDAVGYALEATTVTGEHTLIMLRL